MGIFGKIVNAAVNTVLLPVAVAKDVVTLGGASTGKGSYTLKQLEQIKDEAQ